MQHDDAMQSPVDDETYDLLQTLTSKLEAINAYQQYEEDAQGEARTIFRDMAQQDREHAQRLVGLLRDRLGSQGG
jgi:rubrerythrin